MNTAVIKSGMRSCGLVAAASVAWTLFCVDLPAGQFTVPSSKSPTIQEAVDAAAPGDTILVLPGTYVYSDVTDYWPPAIGIPPNKPGLKLKAVGPPGAVKIVGPGGGLGTGIRIEADNVRLEGFEVSGFRKGIVVSGSSLDASPGYYQIQGVRIARNSIHDCQEAGMVVILSTDCDIDANMVDGGLNGIVLSGWDGPNSQVHVHHNVVTGTLALWNEKGGYFYEGVGIMVAGTPGCQLQQNRCNHNGQAGIYLAGSPGCTAEHNQANNNGSSNASSMVGSGIEVLNSPDSLVQGNETDSNLAYGIWVGTSCGSRLVGNAAWGNGACDLFAPEWGSDPACNFYENNQGGTAIPSLELWAVR